MIFRCPFVLLLVLLAAVPGFAQKAPDKPRNGREILDLSGEWRFHTDAPEQGEANGWPKNAPDDTKTTFLPSLWEKSEAPNYSGAVWYWREFEAPKSWYTPTIVRVAFEGVSEDATVWLNGELLGEHKGGGVPFAFLTGKNIRAGRKNLLTLRVRGDAKHGAGVWQDVKLLAHDEAYISDFFPQGDESGNLNAEVEMQNTTVASGDATLAFVITTAKNLKKAVKTTNQNLGIGPGRNITTLTSFLPKKPLALWSPDKPNLYSIAVFLQQGKDTLDSMQRPLGFRTFTVKENTLLLNGTPLPLKAASQRTALLPLMQSANEKVIARELLTRLKEQGFNVLHLEAPASEILDLTDEIGLLVVIHPRPGQAPKIAAAELETLIRRDRAHPSVLGWTLRETEGVVPERLHALDLTRFLIFGSPARPKLYLPGIASTPSAAMLSGLFPDKEYKISGD